MHPFIPMLAARFAKPTIFTGEDDSEPSATSAGGSFLLALIERFGNSRIDRVVINYRGNWRTYDLSSSEMLNSMSPHFTATPSQFLPYNDQVDLTLSEAAVSSPEANRDDTEIRATLARIEALILEWTNGRPILETREGEKAAATPEEKVVKPTVVDVATIATEVRNYAVEQSAAWRVVQHAYPNATRFALDADPRSFNVSTDGKFDGRAALLISVPTHLRSGAKTDMSVRIATIVTGELSQAGEITVTGVEVAASPQLASASSES